MPLSVADLAALGNTPITILSTTFPSVYLRMDGSGVTTWNGSGSGIVNCQFGAGPYEKFKVLPQADGSFAFASATFSNVYLRMDAAELPKIPGGPGGGTVNCQVNVGTHETFKLLPQAGGSFSFESTFFPNSFLRLVGFGVTASANDGGGVVNCQFGAPGGDHERFFLNVAA